MFQLTPFQWGVIALCGALNAGIGFIVQLVKLPIYLDVIGSVLAGVLLGPLAAVVSAILGSALLSVLTTPIAFAYVGTAVVVSLCASWFSNYGYAKRVVPTVLLGLVLGVLAALMSAPVTTFLFGGVSLAGADAFTAFFKAMGNTLATSVFLGGLSTDPVDKLIMSLICLSIVQGLPQRFKERLASARNMLEHE